MLALSLLVSAATFQPAKLVLDINRSPIPVSSFPSLVCDAAGFALLTAQTPNQAGYKLWRTNGTEAGTSLIASFDLPDGNGSFSCLYADGPGPVYFQFIDGSGWAELWRSDGTAAGTFRLARRTDNLSDIRLLGVLGQPLFIAAIDNAGDEIVTSDGTVAGTRIVADLGPGADGGGYGFSSAVLNGQLLFALNGDLWKTDGSGAGTQRVLDLTASDDEYVQLDNFAVLGNRVLFARVNPAGDSELWSTDSTAAGSAVLHTFSIQPGTPYITALTTVSSTRAVFGVPSASGPVFLPLWRTDGTVAGTQPLNAAEPDLSLEGGRPERRGSGAIFFGRTSAHGREPWFTDGTDAGTFLLADTFPGPGENALFDYSPAPGGFFFGASTQVGVQLWFTDGTPAGTWSVSAANPQLGTDYLNADAVPLTSDQFLVWSQPFTYQLGPQRRTLWRGSISTRVLTRVDEFVPYVLGGSNALRSGRILFSLDLAPYGWEPWITDGTSAGTHLLRNLTPEPVNGSSDPVFGFDIGGALYFGAEDGVNGRSLWRSDGSAAGTQRVAGGAPLPENDWQPLARLGGAVIYPGDIGAGVAELWRTDGTSSGTTLVKDLSGLRPGGGSQVTGSSPGSCGLGFVVAGTTAYYGASPIGVGKLFRTDGTTTGTIELGSFPSTSRLFNGRSRVCVLGQLNGEIYFEAEDPLSQTQVLWRANGQPGGYARVLTDGGAPLPAPLKMSVLNGSLYFMTSSQGQMGLWQIGPVESVARLRVPRTWPNDNAFPVVTAIVGSTLLFRDCATQVVGNNGTTVCTHYRTDGTPAGTMPLGAIQGNYTGSEYPGARLGNRFIYTGVADALGFDLWFTDGTAAGTTSLRVPSNAAQVNQTTDFTVFNGLVYFTVAVETNGFTHREFWRTDGTAAGTERANSVTDVVSYLKGARMAVTGNRLLFASASEAESVELWSIENEAPVAQADSGSTTSPNAVSIDILLNDVDPDGQLARGTVRLTRAPASGTAVVESAGTVRYTPAAGFTGSDSLQYTVADTQGRESAAATVSIAIAAAPSGGGGTGGGGGGNGATPGGGGGGAAGWYELLALSLLLAGMRRRRQRYFPMQKLPKI